MIKVVVFEVHCYLLHFISLSYKLFNAFLAGFATSSNNSGSRHNDSIEEILVDVLVSTVVFCVAQATLDTLKTKYIQF